MMLILLYASLFIISTFFFKSFLNNTSKLPPGPLALPVIGHLHLLGPLIHQTFHHLSSRYGPLIYLRLGSVSCVVASSPELAKELLKTNELAFSARVQTAAINHLSYEYSSLAFAPYGPYWKFIKKLSTYELLSSRSLNQFLPIRRKELHHLIATLLQKSKSRESVNLTQELLKLTNNVISQMMMSLRCSEVVGDQADDVRTIVREVTEIFGEFNISDIIWFCKNLDLQGSRKKFEDVRRRYDALSEKIIRNREEMRKNKKFSKKDNGDLSEVKDFLDILLDALEDDKSEVKLTRNHIKALILDFFTAATDTTAIASEWALAELINHPEVLKKAQKEIDEVVGKNRLVEESDNPNLRYIHAVIKETFRLHPPVPMVSRRAVQECKVGAYTIPEGAFLFVNVWSIGRDSKVWEDPFKFRPERFLKSENAEASGSIDIKGLHYQLLPFGSGRRSCPGVSLAMQELPTILAAMIQCFDWKVVVTDGGKHGVVDVVDMDERPGLTAPRARNLECFPISRLGSVPIGFVEVDFD